MRILEERIRKDGKVFPGNILKVDSFLNHQIDVHLLEQIGEEFYRLFGQEQIDKIMTIEASGIGIACITAQRFGVPVVFAKKSQSINISADVFTSKVASYTHGKVYDVIVSKEFLHSGERVLIVDDFLAKGQAMLGLIEIVRSAGAVPVGAGIVIEKGFQEGGELIRQAGVRLESLAVVESMSDDGAIVFRG
ncbi:MAG: xanthine phosphoribosyltransferase [Oscillospiraceae bacterium]|nr:xanthine phosphoribosyltransferase [Oscillospiraceae bacterium]